MGAGRHQRQVRWWFLKRNAVGQVVQPFNKLVEMNGNAQ